MSDTPTAIVTNPVQPATPHTPEPAGQPASPAAQPVTPVTPSQSDSGDPALDTMTVEQLDQLAARVAQVRANRPPSLAQALSMLQEQLTATHREKDGAVAEKRDAAALADKFDQSISEIQRTLRRTELAEAATAVGFKTPLVVAEYLVGQDGDVAELVTKAAASGAWAMNTPATSAQVGGSQSRPATDLEPGMQALIDEINKAHGRT